MNKSQSTGVFSAISDAFTGAAQLSFPIEVPPGTNGVQPTIALQYSSSSTAPSWVGKGWNLSFGVVELSLKRGVPRYNATDVFTLNGEELVADPVDPRIITALGIPSRYRTRRESYQRVDLDVLNNKWIVTQTNGTRLIFGSSDESRIRCNLGLCDALTPTGQDGSRNFPTFAWHLDSIETPDGNVVQYRYYPQTEAEGDIGRVYPREVRYTLRKTGSGGVVSLNGSIPPQNSVDRVISFVLEPRPDTRLGFAGRFEQRMTKRLAKIEIRVANQLLRVYALRYTSSDDSFASLLTAIDLFGVNGQGAARTSTFQYTGNNPICRTPCQTLWTADPRFELRGNVDFVAQGNTDGGLREGDMTVDGIPDIVRSLDSNLLANSADLNGTFESSPDGLKDLNTTLRIPFSFATVRRADSAFFQGGAGVIFADLSGDGRPDLMSIDTAVNAAGARITIPQFVASTDAGSGLLFTNRQVAATRLHEFSFGLLALRRAQDGTDLVLGVGGGTSLAELDGDGFPDLVQSSFFKLINTPNQGYALNEIGRNGGRLLVGNLFLDTRTFPGFDSLGAPTGPPSVRDRNYFICDAISTPAFATALGRPVNCSLDAAITIHEVTRTNVGEGEPKGKRFYDVNGDGLDDFQSAYAGFPDGLESPGGPIPTRLTVLNDGTRFERFPRDRWNIPSDLVFETTFRPNVATRSFTTFDRAVRLLDINGDSISDLVVATDPGVNTGPTRRIYLGTQSDAMPWRLLPDDSGLQLPPDVAFTDGDAVDRGVRVLDLSGDRVADITRADKGVKRAYRSTARIPDLLSVATTPDGGTQTFEYSTSAKQRNADGSPKNPGLHLNMPVVSKMTMHDLFNPAVVTDFEYEGGKFDSLDREFRGFRMVRATRAADGRITEMLFHQDIQLAGLVEKVTIKEPDGTPEAHVRLETFNGYTDDDNNGAPFARLPSGTVAVERPPKNVVANPRITATRIHYETVGNVIQFGRISAMEDLGEFNPLNDTDLDPHDTRTMEFEYTPVDANAYITDRTSVMRLRAGPRGQGGAIVRETRLFYDDESLDGPSRAPLRGLLTAQRAVLNDPLGNPDPLTTFAYDDFGNMKSVTSPRANAGQGGGTTSMDYDATLKTFMVKVTNALGHATQLSYAPDPVVCPSGPPIGLGLVYAEQGPNDTTMTRSVSCYDRLGRITLQRASDNLADTTTSYIDTPGAAQITVSQRASTSGRRGVLMNLDGFGRVRSTVTDGPQGKLILQFTTLDAAGRPFLASPSVFFPETRSALPTITLYDVLDRVVRIERPGAPSGSDSVPGPRIETLNHDLPGRVTTTDANSNQRTRFIDGFGNVARVDEITPSGTFTTKYTYDAAGALKTVTDHDQNVTRIDYDRLGRRTKLVDPDMGTRTFGYDAGGNVVQETGPSGTITSTYDILDRLRVRIAGGRIDRMIEYDTAPKGIGLAASITEGDAGKLSILAYDALGRELSSRRQIDGFSFDFATTFDPLGQPVRRTLPNGTVYTRIVDSKGYTQEFASGTAAAPTQNKQITGVEFDPLGRVARYQTANGTVTTTAFELDTQRLHEIKIEAAGSVLERRTYKYDRGDRIMSIKNLASANRDQLFEYDALNRLTKATGPYAAGSAQTSLYYTYSAIGNLTCLDSTSPTSCTGGKSFQYSTGGSQPHAPISVNGSIASYTSSGNLRMLGTRKYTYDALERLTIVEDATQGVRARFTYTSSGQRIKSRDFTGPRPVTQYLLSDDFEFDRTRKLARIHLALGGATVATLTQPYEPAQSTSALAPPAPTPFPVGPALASAVLLFALLGLALQLARLQRQGLPLGRPALASALILAFWTAGVPGAAWALPLDGDLNADERLDAADALIALDIAEGRAPSIDERSSGDVAPLGAAPSQPSVVDTADALLILRAAQGDDVDGDGLSSQDEVTFGSSPFKRDTDGDGVFDDVEKNQGSDPRNGPNGDADGDGVSDGQEVLAKTDPYERDTDGDGLLDNTDLLPRQGIRFLHTDQLGSTILATGANGAVLERVAYRPYGGTVAPSSGPTATPHFGFTGQRFEAGIGIYDYRARFYDPALGRFLQPDSIVPDPGDPQSLNRYSYVRNNPINRIDPTGNADGLIDLLRENSTRIGGAVQAGFGAVAIAGGAALCTTGVGCVLGGAAIALGADNFATGVQAAITNEETDLLTSRGLQAAGVERDTANAVAAGVDIAVGGLAGAGKGLVKQGIKEGLESVGDDAVRAAADLAGDAAGGGNVLLDSSVIPSLGKDPTLGGRLLAGEQGVASFVTRPELRNAVARGGRLGGVPRALDDLPVLSARPSVDSAINVRGLLPSGRGRFGDGVIGGQAIDLRIPLVTNDRRLADAVRALGGSVR